MKKHRVIPVLFLRNGFLVQSKQFKRYQNLGNPVTAVKHVKKHKKHAAKPAAAPKKTY